LNALSPSSWCFKSPIAGNEKELTVNRIDDFASVGHIKNSKLLEGEKRKKRLSALFSVSEDQGMIQFGRIKHWRFNQDYGSVSEKVQTIFVIRYEYYALIKRRQCFSLSGNVPCQWVVIQTTPE
jgi:hypothetical protein